MSAHQLERYFNTSHAFIIGVNDYKYLNKLNNAVNDALGVAQVLKRNVHAYTVHPPILNPTYEELLHVLEHDIPKVVTEKDRLFFLFCRAWYCGA
jgi:hypothetical protein